MSSEASTLLGVQDPQILHVPRGVVTTAAAEAAIWWAESCGVVLDRSQCISLETGMGERADGKWAAFEVLDIGPRQSTGKTETACARTGHAMFIAGSKLVVHTAHESKTADEAFTRMQEMISNNSEMKAEVYRFVLGSGDHSIAFKSGARLLYKTRTGGGVRGFAGAELLLYDEALFLLAKHVSASLAILARGKTRAHNPQVWSMSSAALATSSYMHEARRRALVGNGGEMRIDGPGKANRLAYIDHTAERVALDPKGKVVSLNRGMVDLDDHRIWAIPNPSMNQIDHGVSEEFIEAEKALQSFDLEGWARERLGFFDPPVSDAGQRDAAIPVELWSAAGELDDDGAPSSSVAGGPVALAWSVNEERTWSSVGFVGERPDGKLHGEVVRDGCAAGTDWVVPRLVKIAVAGGERVLAFGYDPSSPGAALVPDLERELRKAGVSLSVMVDNEKKSKLVKVGGQQYTAACGALFDAVAAGRFKHRCQPELSNAVDGAHRKLTAESWRWDRRSDRVDITPLDAVTIALRTFEVAPRSVDEEVEVNLW